MFTFKGLKSIKASEMPKLLTPLILLLFRKKGRKKDEYNKAALNNLNFQSSEPNKEFSKSKTAELRKKEDEYVSL